MDEKQAVLFLFNIAKEIKYSFEHAVILLTMKDYADCIFNSLVDMRTALLQNAANEQVIQIINTAHLNWLQAVQDVEDFKSTVRDVPRDIIYKAVEYTQECAKNRYKYFKRYVDQLQSSMTAEERKLMESDFEISNDMQIALNNVLEDKQKCMTYLTNETEFYNKLTSEADDLLNWLDKLNDNLALQFSKVVGLNSPDLLIDLTRTMHDIGDEVIAAHDAEAQNLLEQMKGKQKVLSSMIRFDVSDDLEVRKIQEKIINLKARIQRLRKEDSLAVTALQHKTNYLEDRLHSIENLKGVWHTLQNNCIDEEPNIRIFEHMLPAQDRCHLVEQLLNLWNDAICGTPDEKSIISILSVADLKEVYSDDLGRFTIDQYGRKLYKIKGDDILYQRDNNNKLVELNDDDKHVYFFDECGRYYINDSNKHVYKAHARASEYMIFEDKMLKIEEIRNNTEYHYDHLGRYRLDENNKKIYYEEGSIHKYEHDDLGNLVRIISEEQIYNYCPVEPMVTVESKYLQLEVGTALRKCLADVVLHQPADPIKYLANSLEKYWYTTMAIQQRIYDEAELATERELHLRTQELQDLNSSAPSFIMSGEESTAYSASTKML